MSVVCGPVAARLERFGDVVRQVTGLAWTGLRLLPYVRGPRWRTALLTLGVRSAPLVATAAFFSGMVMALQVSVELSRFGAHSLVSAVVSVTFVRELGPVFAALLLAGKAGSGIASEFGAMLLSGELGAMRALSIDFDRRLLAPTLWAAVVSTIGLTILADLSGILGGMALARVQIGVSPVVYLEAAVRALEPADLVGSVVKSVVFGVTIALSGAWYGLRDKRSPRQLGADTMRAVVTASFLVLILDHVVSRVLAALLEG